jgi:Ca2+-transporting ATPase
VLGVAARTDDGQARFLGVVGLLDPPRDDVPEAVAALRRAGVRVLMVTGDNAHTARHIAHRVGIVDDAEADAHDVLASGLGDAGTDIAVWARVDPAQKLEIVRALQERGDVVAMTGDGVNDAPALRQADIGVAMGQRGTQVAREAAHMVLTDDRFAAVAVAVRLGRGIFANIRKFVVYLLSCNLSEVLVVAFATLAGLPLPLAPLQILYLNLVTDVFPALALGACAPATGTMDRPPRDPEEPVLTPRHARRIVVSGLVLTGAVLGAFTWALADGGGADPVTVAFMTLAFAQLWHVFAMRTQRRAVLRNEVTANPWVWGAIALCTVLLLIAMYVPVLSNALAVRPLPPRAWSVALAFSVMPLALNVAFSLAGIGKRDEASVPGSRQADH